AQPQPQPQPQQAVDFPMSLLQEARDACVVLTRRVEHLEYDKVAQALEITKLKRRVKKLEKGNRIRVLKLRRLKQVGTSQSIDTSDDTVIDDESNQGRIIDKMDKDDVVALIDDKEEDKKDDKEEDKKDEKAKEDEPAKVHEVVDVVTTAKDPEEESTTSSIIPVETKSKDKGKGIMVEEPKPLKKKQQIEMDEEYARKLDVELNKDIDWDVAIDHEENRALQSINETPAQKAAKKRKLNEEVEDHKRHLEIVPDEDDDVYTEATPLARKVPVVDYKIIELNNKPYYKIIRDDGTYQLYISFLTLLKNFDREDLEALWSLVKEIFSTSKPKNFSDDFLLTILGAMFEKPDAQAQVWKNQRTIHGQAKVKCWKLLESCGVHIITFTIMQLILLIERRYPLLRFTLDQMLNNVRLQVEEESKVFLELLRFTRQHHQEGQLE
nr:hypothetical protein [Tanacetum cinerariifolium]